MLDDSVDEARLSKLAIFLADLGGGGAERMMVVIANGMVERGVEVELILAAARGPYLSEVDERVKLIDFATGRVATALPKLVRYLRRSRPDVMLTTLAHTSLVALASRTIAGTGVPVVVREANTPTATDQRWSSFKSRLSRRLIHRAYRQADGVIAVSDGVAKALAEVVGVDPAKIATLYNPVVSPELHRLADIDPEHPWLADDVPVLLGVGSLTPRKDFRTLLEAFALVRARRRTRLIILGEGPERRALERLADQLGVSADLDLPGFVQNPFGYMSRTDVYVLSSNLEGLPGSLIQALACGCPSVATDCESGPREILQDGRIGPLVDVGDAEGMAAAIESQLDAPGRAQDLVASVQKYDAATVLDSVRSYLDLISSKRRRA